MGLVKLIEEKDCDLIYKSLLDQTSGTYRENNCRPWQEGNNVFYELIKDFPTKKLTRNYIIKLSILISLKYKKEIYPHFADLVLWNKGKSMQNHFDDGSPDNPEEVNNILRPRYISAITYLNDDYEGGKTVVDGVEHTPKKGYTLIFRSNISHGVTEVIKGQRGILATWFTDDYKHFYL